MRIDPQSPWLMAISDDFIEDMYRVALARDGEDLESLEVLANLLTRRGRHAEGLELDERIVSLDPDNAIAHYNLACSLSLVHRRDEALESLEQAVRLGYRDHEHTVADDDLVLLRDDPRFDRLLTVMRGVGT